MSSPALSRAWRARGESYAQLAQTLGMSGEEMAEALSALRLEDDEELVCSAASLSEKDRRYILSLPRRERNRLFYGLLADNRELETRAGILRERLRGWRSGSHPRTIAFNDVRIFFNTIDRAVDVMREAGINAVSERQDLEDFVEYKIRIPASEAFARR
ncbi:MAG: hypothetical protein Q4B42_00670 [Oscillospiraceae bacterium]|nr:hypothetical protein [Oscillospiraceae bacterium]